MKLSEVFGKEHLVGELTASGKGEAIRELVRRLCDKGSLPNELAQKVERAVLRREELGSTGIGKGVGVPHAKCAGVSGVIGAVGRSRQGVEFNALDGQPVHLIFLLVSGPDAVKPHLEALRKVTALLKDGDFCAFMVRAKDDAEMSELLGEAEQRLCI